MLMAAMGAVFPVHMDMIMVVRMHNIRSLSMPYTASSPQTAESAQRQQGTDQGHQQKTDPLTPADGSAGFPWEPSGKVDQPIDQQDGDEALTEGSSSSNQGATPDLVAMGQQIGG
jgi:hypothetical protein